MWPKSISIQVRVWLVLVLMLATVVAMAFASISAMQQSSYLLERADKSNRQLELALRISSEIKANLVYQINSLIQGQITPGLIETEQRILELFDQMNDLTEAEIAFVENADEQEEEEEEFSAIVAMHDEVYRLFELALQAEAFAPGTDRSLAVRALTSQLTSTVNEQLTPLIEAFIDEERTEIEAVEAEMKSLQTNLISLGIMLVLVCMILTVLSSLHINSILIQPIRALIEATSAMSSGNLRSRMAKLGRDELGLLGLHFNRMASHLERNRDRLQQLNIELEAKVAERTEHLEASNEKLQMIDKSRKRFLANVSHELRTPLTAIIGEIELCQTDIALEQTTLSGSLLRINANAEYLRRRVQDLLLLARSDEGTLNIVKGEQELTRLLEGVIKQVAAIAQVERVKLELIAEHTSAFVIADQSWLGQCLMALIDNAIKFSLPGNTVKVILADAEPSWRIDILDQGPGFQTDALPKLFDRYYQTDEGRQQGGSGLGLAIARWIIEEHQGDITARNTPNGACISIRLHKVSIKP